MAARKRETIYDWIYQCFNDPELTNDGKKEPAGMVLLHVKNGLKVTEIDSVTFGSGKKWVLEELAERFETKADFYAQDLTGVQMFQLNAFYEGSKEPKSRKPFRVTGALSHGEDGLDTEGPTPTGIVQSLMRHNEVILQTCNKQTAMLFEMSAQMMQIMAQEKNKLINDNQDQFALIRDLMMKQLELGHTGRMEMLEYERKSEDRKAMLRMLPSLANSITGKEIFTESAEDTALVDTVAEELTPEMLKKLAEILPPKVTGMLATRMAKALDKKQAVQRDGEIRLANGVDHDSELQ